MSKDFGKSQMFRESQEKIMNEVKIFKRKNQNFAIHTSAEICQDILKKPIARNQSARKTRINSANRIQESLEFFPSMNNFKIRRIVGE